VPTVNIRLRATRTGKGFRAVNAQFRANAAILPIKTAANIALVAQEMAPVWHGTVNPGKTGHAHTYPVPGHLRSSITAVDNKVTVGAHYGFFVEFGTRYMHQEPFLRPACQLVYRTQFREDVKRMFSEDITRGGMAGLVVAAPPAIAYRHSQHVLAKVRNQMRTPAQRRYEVHRRFTAMRTRGLHMGGVTVKI
jgi:HK97 gp10 family phage protein